MSRKYSIGVPQRSGFNWVKKALLALLESSDIFGVAKIVMSLALCDFLLLVITYACTVHVRRDSIMNFMDNLL